MKYLIIILSGILIGSGSTLLIQRSKSQAKTTILNEVNGVDFGGMKATDLSTDNLYIADFGGESLTITSKKHPKLGVMISSMLNQDMMSRISLLDHSGAQASFIDRDSDGIWDDIDFSKNDITYGYGRLDGFPDIIMLDGEAKIRIGDDYFIHKNIDGKHFIEKDGELVEVEYTKHFQFNIK